MIYNSEFTMVYMGKNEPIGTKTVNRLIADMFMCIEHPQLRIQSIELKITI